MTQILKLIITVMLLVTGITVVAQEETATEAVTPENTAYVRVAHFSPDGGEVDLYFDDAAVDADSLSYQQVSDWMAVPAGEHSLTAAPTGTSQADAVFEPVSLDLMGATWTTVMVVDAAEGEGLTTQTVQEDYSDLLPGTAGFTIVHAAQGVPSLNMVRDGVVYVTGLSYTPEAPISSSFIDDSGTYSIQFVEPETPDTAVIDQPEAEIPENTYTLIAVVGTADSPELLIDVTDASEVALVTGQLDEPGTLVEAAQNNENLTTLAAELQSSGLMDELDPDAEYTVFAPANFVLDNVDTSDTQAVSDLLRNHIVEGKMTSQDVFNAETLTTLGGTELQITRDGDNVLVNGAQIIEVNIPATNGVIHMLNGIIQPAE